MHGTTPRPRPRRRAALGLTLVALLLGAAACTRPGGGGGTTTTRPAPPTTTDEHEDPDEHDEVTTTTRPGTPTTPPVTSAPTTRPPTGGGVQLPPANAGLDYQLGATYTPLPQVKVLSRDRESSPVAGLYNICYINGFQAQTEAESWWLTNHGDLVLKDSGGRPVKDTEWNELILDTSTPAKRSGLAGIIGGWIEGCRSKGFQAVEFDNLDTYSRSGGRLNQQSAVAYLRLLTDKSHSLGLAAAQKNSADVVGSKAQMGTDFAVVEECNRWDECDAFTRVYGNQVYIIEYRQQDFAKGCSRYPQLSIVLRDVPLSTKTTADKLC
jgi:hypothetical protein